MAIKYNTYQNEYCTMATTKDERIQQITVLLPTILYIILSSPEFKYRLYVEYMGKEPTCQGHIDQVYDSVKYELFYMVQMLYFKQHQKADPYMYFSQQLFKFYFKRKYLVIKDLLEDIIGFEARSSVTSNESYMRGENGYTKSYRSNIDLNELKMLSWTRKNNHGTKQFIKVEFPYHVSKRLKEFSHRHEDQEFINLVNACQSMVDIDETAPEYFKEEFYSLPTMLTKKRTDNRFYGMGSGSSKKLREYMRYGDEKLVEVDLPSAYVHFSIANCYEKGNFDHFEEKTRLTMSMRQQNIYDQIVDMYDISRDDVKEYFNSIMNNKITDPSDLDIYQRAVWEFINEKYPIYAQYMLDLNTQEYGESLENKLQRKLYNDSRRVAYLFNSQEESTFMMEFIYRFTDKYGKMGFLFVHDAVYLPESYAEKGKEMMYDLFEELYNYKIN